MNVIWIVADTFRQDHLGAYGNGNIHTPALDTLASRSVRFDRHYAAGFPTMPTRADHATGRWTMSFMGWEPLPSGAETLAGLLAADGIHTAAMVDTPFYLRGEMNYDRGFQTFATYPGQSLADVDVLPSGREAMDARAAWRFESDRNVAQTMTMAMRWLEGHYKEDFFLYVDTWDPHEPWDAPEYYTKLYAPDYDGEVMRPTYGRWQDTPGHTRAMVDKAHATYCGEVTMVDTWVGHLLRLAENMGLMENTAVIFTSHHGFYFGEHGGLFGKMTLARQQDGTLHSGGDWWDFCPLYEEVAKVPLIVYVPGVDPGASGGLTSAVDLMPTVLEIMGRPIPPWVEGVSLLPSVRDPAAAGRDFHGYDHAFRQRWRSGALGRRLPAVADAGAGDYGQLAGVVAAVQSRGGRVRALPPPIGPLARTERDRRQRRRRQGPSRAAGRVHARHRRSRPVGQAQAGAAGMMVNGESAAPTMQTQEPLPGLFVADPSE